MGNTSSTSQPPTTASGQAAATPPSSAAPTSIHRSTPQTISAPATSTSATFHSGLTPPAVSPSPPPPSTPPLLPHAGHLSPQNPHALSLPQAHDYSKSVVTRLIIDAKLAPFYRGMEDFEEQWTEEDIGRVLNEVREKDYEEGVRNSVTERLKEERQGSDRVGSVVKKIGIHRGRDARREEEKEERERRERKAYVAATECPICFLNYPPNINTSRCCQQPICTECFVQIKRSEATITHLESEPACCPYCVETDFGVIYERPSITGMNSAAASQSALSMSPEQGTSGFSQALSMGSVDPELNVGPGMAPKTQETIRRKSVSSKATEVVTIDEIRPDWEQKLNAVKAAAARRASRRIVMRQVGDRLIPIGFTSSRAPGTADFSMSIPQEEGSRRRRGTRERDLEELMIMEAMRLSLLDHEEHQRKMADEKRKPKSGDTTPTGEPSRKRSDTVESKSGASKLLSKLGGRSRSGSSASKLNEPRVSVGSGSGSGSPRPPPTPSNASSGNSVPTAPSPTSRTPPILANSSTGPLAASTPSLAAPPATSTQSAGLPRLSLDMPALTPEAPGMRKSVEIARASMEENKARTRHVSDQSGGSYAELGSTE